MTLWITDLRRQTLAGFRYSARAASPRFGRRGVISRPVLLVVVGLFGLGLLVFGPLRSWWGEQLEANTNRSTEFKDRVQAKRLAAIRPELAEAGIEIGEAVPADSDTALAPAPTEPGFLERSARWWRKVRGVPEPLVPLPFPDLPDSLGLRPGERMFLPDGRVIHYDSTTFRVQKSPGR